MNSNPTVRRIAILQGHPDPMGNHLSTLWRRLMRLVRKRLVNMVQGFSTKAAEG